jgi:hypothetical protein
MLAGRAGIELRWVPLTADGQLDLTDLDRLLDGAKVFSFTAMSNVLGTITPVQQLCRRRPRAGALAIVDGCQYVPHNVTDVQAWGADFLAFSSHKLCGPTGHRRAVGPRGAARRDAAVPRRRQHDRRRHASTGSPPPSCPPSSRPAPRRSPRRSAGRRGRLPRPGSGMDAVRRHEIDVAGTRCAPSPSASATTSPSTARPTWRCAAPRSASPSAASTPTTSARCSTSTTCACAPATTAPSR